MRLSNLTKSESLTEYGMSGSGAPTPVGAQGMGTTAKATNQQRKTDRAPAPSPTTSQQQQQQTADGDDTKQPAVAPAGELEKDSQFMDPEQNTFTVVSPQGQINPEIPNDDPNTIVVQDEQGMIYALDPDTQVTVGEVEESVFNRFDKLSLEEQLNIIAKLDSKTINEAWSKKYKDSINCSNPKGFSQRAHCAGRKKTENIELKSGEHLWLVHYRDGRKEKVVAPTLYGVKLRLSNDASPVPSNKELGIQRVERIYQSGRKPKGSFGFNNRGYTADMRAKKKQTNETIEAEQDMAALLTAYGTPDKRKRKKSKKEAVGESVPNNDAEHKLRQIMSQPLLSGDIRSQMTAYIALPDPDMLLQFRLRRAEGGDDVDLRDVVKQYMEKLHPRVKARLEQE